MSNKKNKSKKFNDCCCEDGYVYYGSGCSMKCDSCRGTGKVEIDNNKNNKVNWQPYDHRWE